MARLDTANQLDTVYSDPAPTSTTSTTSTTSSGSGGGGGSTPVAVSNPVNIGLRIVPVANGGFAFGPGFPVPDNKIVEIAPTPKNTDSVFVGSGDPVCFIVGRSIEIGAGSNPIVFPVRNLADITVKATVGGEGIAVRIRDKS